MKRKLEESLGLGFYPVGKLNLPARISSHGTDQLEARFPQLTPENLKPILAKGLPKVAEPNGFIRLGHYLIVDRETGVMLPVKVMKNDKPGFERQTIAFVPTVMDYDKQTEYPQNILDKYDIMKRVFTEGVEQRWEIQHLSEVGSYNGEPCEIAYV